jgi:hypothetical protein
LGRSRFSKLVWPEVRRQMMLRVIDDLWADYLATGPPL